MRIAVIGGSGHVGTFLIPRLVRAGHDVVVLTRGQSKPYLEDPAWDVVERVVVDRAEAEAAGTFGGLVAALDADAVVDMVCFTVGSALALVDSLRGRTGHLVHCGSIWMHGLSQRVPILEEDSLPPVGEYGVRKALIAKALQQETAAGGLITTSIHPGHISGPGWAPIGPLGNLDPEVWRILAAGLELSMPGLGTELMSHVHADDVAQLFELALANREAAAGHAFHATAATALTVRGFAAAAASWFGQEPRLRSVSWESFRSITPAEFADQSWQHLSRNHHVSIEKARRLLGYQPQHAPEDAARTGVDWMLANGLL
ncbi:nucleoside-diphosphate-sugar epimerase [Nakamurella sp. UYEF19]|uniref:NAD-dependent epimerase/dehydratase family protein n=1 Tax=Nakamurella sp. UYEF19 TaxID=1756392 RepID=UPI003396916C